MVRRPRNCSWLLGNPYFHNLTDSDFRCASDPDDDYNCIAWAGGKTDRPWWPTSVAPYWWPDDLPKDYPPHVAEKLDNFITVFERQGYKVCRSRRFSRRYEKVAIYVSDRTGRATHAARTLPSGIWSSKMGEHEDIEHRRLECIQGNSYGTVRAILKRKWPADQKPKLRIFRWLRLMFSNKP